MKFLFSILALFLVNKECDSKKTTPQDTTNNTIAVANASQLNSQQDEKMTISYTAQTRGSYQNITVSETEVSIANTRDKKDTKIFPCNALDWKEISSLMAALDLELLSEIKAPSTNSYRDAALAAQLTVFKDGQKLSAANFDHGNPPKEIETLVNKLLSMKQNNEKQ